MELNLCVSVDNNFINQKNEGKNQTTAQDSKLS